MYVYDYVGMWVYDYVVMSCVPIEVEAPPQLLYVVVHSSQCLYAN
jgi:hypothetical protein